MSDCLCMFMQQPFSIVQKPFSCLHPVAEVCY